MVAAYWDRVTVPWVVRVLCSTQIRSHIEAMFYSSHEVRESSTPMSKADFESREALQNSTHYQAADGRSCLSWHTCEGNIWWAKSSCRQLAQW